MNVREAADRLGISEFAVRKHLAAGRLAGRKWGRDWFLEPRSVERRSRQRPSAGRPLSAALAWATIFLASGDEESAARVAGSTRYCVRAHAWLESHSMAKHAASLRARAQVEQFDAHSSELSRIMMRGDTLATGSSVAGLAGLIGGEAQADAYAPHLLRERIIRDHLLEPGPGPVTLRWISDGLWPMLDPQRTGRAPTAAVLLDLLEADDPRARREALRELRN